jgi:2-polyprenyl-3-methyl-5-hydroxy-6-metoxy-1,4-benzoquinol methylase
LPHHERDFTRAERSKNFFCRERPRRLANSQVSVVLERLRMPAPGAEGYVRELLRREREAQAKHDYLNFHARRFEYTLRQCLRLKPAPDTRVLDIGRSHLSRLLLSHYKQVVTLGLPPADHEPFGHEAEPREDPEKRDFAGHLAFDLNESRYHERPLSPLRFDLIVFAEVLEHLYTAPELVLHHLLGYLAEGGLILCQTPNAAALHKRLLLLVGKNPYERLRIDLDNPGHFREYTRQELVEIGEKAGLKVAEHEYVDYYAAPSGWTLRLAVHLLRLLGLVFPAFLRAQTLVFVRQT